MSIWRPWSYPSFVDPLKWPSELHRPAGVHLPGMSGRKSQSVSYTNLRTHRKHQGAGQLSTINWLQLGAELSIMIGVSRGSWAIVNRRSTGYNWFNILSSCLLVDNKQRIATVILIVGSYPPIIVGSWRKANKNAANMMVHTFILLDTLIIIRHCHPLLVKHH